MQLKKKQN